MSPLASQVFDNTPAALEGMLAAGDEITGVNGKPVKGKTKVEVAKMIQAVQVHFTMALLLSIFPFPQLLTFPTVYNYMCHYACEMGGLAGSLTIVTLQRTPLRKIFRIVPYNRNV